MTIEELCEVAFNQAIDSNGHVTLQETVRAAMHAAVAEATQQKFHPLADVYKCQGRHCQAVWVKRPIGQEGINSNEAGHHGWEYDGERWLCQHCTGSAERAVAEAVAAKEAELMQVQTALGHAEADVAELRDELVALRVPVGPVTMEEARIIGDAWYSVPGMGEDAEKAICAAVDKLIAPRVAQAVAAELASWQTKSEFLKAERERHAAELARLQAFKNWVHSYLDKSGVPHHPPGIHGQEGCRIGDRMDWLMAEQAATDQRWKERLKVVQEELATFKRQSENTINYWQNSTKAADAALATKKANWKAHLERVEAEHRKALTAEKASARDRIQKGSWRVVELTIEGAERRFEERQAKAVAAAYEEARRMIEAKRDRANELEKTSAASWLTELLESFLQLAAKPQGSAFNPDGMFTTTRTDNHGNPLGPKPASKSPDCDLTQAADPPPAAREPYRFGTDCMRIGDRPDGSLAIYAVAWRQP